MDMIWWLFPAVSGVLGLMLSFAGLGKLAKLKPLSGGGRLVFGTGFLGLGAVVAFTGLNLQTYSRLTAERPVATISFEETVEPGLFDASILYPEAEAAVVHQLRGDQFLIAARVITFKPLANLLGYDSVYRLDFIEGRGSRAYTVEAVTDAQVNGVALSENPGLDVSALADQYGSAIGVAQRDANFGSAVYNPMADGLSYDVFITQRGLIARAANDLTRRRLGERPEGQTPPPAR
ncbi:MAG: hypothetical protein AAFX03_13585 [Pseudomonadota bacterium]